MTKKDYELIAHAIRYANVFNAVNVIGTDRIITATTNCIIWNMCQRLEEVNPRFNKDKFLDACRYTGK